MKNDKTVKDIMKKLYILFFASLLSLNANSQARFCDDFEGISQFLRNLCKSNIKLTWKC